MSDLPESLRVGVESIDARHEEFWHISERLKACADCDFIDIFERLVAHTVQHFAEEEADMDNTNYPNNHEHKAEHKKAIEEMNYFMDKAKNNKLFFAKAYAAERLENWFRTHLLNMDSDLARVMKTS
jgi:hemerythrin